MSFSLPFPVHSIFKLQRASDRSNFLSNFAGPLEIIPQVNLDALNRFLIDPINEAANAKLNTLNDLGLAAGDIGNILSSNIIDTANAQVNNAYSFP